MNGHVRVREATPADLPTWLAMRRALFSQETDGMLAEEANGILGSKEEACLLAVDRRGAAWGFIEVSVRPWAEGCETTPVAYVEGWYVRDEARGNGIGRTLVESAVAWARARGLRELASDAEVANVGSHGAHRALGFEERVRLVCYRRNL